MTTRTDKFKGSMALALLAFSILGAQACGDDDNYGPPVGGAGRANGGSGGRAPNPSDDAGSGGTGNEGPGPGPEAGSSGSGGSGGDGAAPPPTEGGSAGSAGSAGNGGDDGGGNADCFANPQKTEDNAEFLNRCPTRGTSCAPFDNAARIPGFTGELPDI